jgi:uncharacterized protein (TIGR00266 family)
MHEIDYKIYGDDMQFVEVELDPMEAVVAEAGGMMFMDDGIQMETIFGDGSQQNSGFLGSLLGAGKRLLTGESLFMTVFQNRGSGKRKVAFGAPYPGKIIPIHLQELGGELLAQKDGFLCAAKGVTLGIAFTKRLGAGFFGGEGFILQRLQGDGLAFVHAGGTIYQRDLAPGEVLRVDTGCIVAFQPSVDYDIQMVGGIKSALFGGEGLFFATLRGPGASGCNRCRSAAWPGASWPRRRRPAGAGARKGRCWAAWAVARRRQFLIDAQGHCCSARPGSVRRVGLVDLAEQDGGAPRRRLLRHDRVRRNPRRLPLRRPRHETVRRRRHAAHQRPAHRRIERARTRSATRRSRRAPR